MAPNKAKKSNLHANHRQRMKNKFFTNGFNGFSEHEMLEMLLFYSVPQADTNPTAHELINKCGGLKNVFDASYENLLSVDGVGMHSAILIKLVQELALEYSRQKTRKGTILSNQLLAIDFISTLFENEPNEILFVICLDAKNSVINCQKLGEGDFCKVSVQIRTITNHILKNNCDRIIIAHNHPYTKPNPSDEDILMTHKLTHSCILNDIDVLDHIIWSPEGSYSFAGEGIMKGIKSDILATLKYSENSLPYRRFHTSTEEYVIVPTNK